MRKKSGFTLIELLVVIAIIALLLSIIVPSFSKAKEHMRMVLCQSNLKQYGMAMQMYLDDNDRRFPTTSIWLKKTTSPYRFLMENEQPDGVFWPYISSFDIHLCPSFLDAARGTSWIQDPGYFPKTDGTKIRGNYTMNSYMLAIMATFGLLGWAAVSKE